MITKKERIIKRILSNKTGQHFNIYNKYDALQKIQFTITYKKKKKEIIEILELLSFLEQITANKSVINMTGILEKNFIVKLTENKLYVSLVGFKAENFINIFKYMLLSERAEYNINEKK